jgi:PTS system mannose-specific IIA component
MIGILIVTHGNLGETLLLTAEMIMGKQDNIRFLALPYDKDINELQKEIADCIVELDQGSGVIVFTDLFGGSPNNSVAMNLRDRQFAALTGVNLPMLVECLSLREFTPLDELAVQVREAGISGIKDLNEVIKKGGEK